MTRKRRYLISAAVLAACVGIALGVIAMLPPRPGVTKANFDRIEKGMTRAEVNEVFGQEGWSYSIPRLRRFHIWRHQDGAHATLSFHDGRVTSMGWQHSTETIPDKLRRWLHLPK
jgi:hypothetical protein